jgi:hypothetical protein
MGLYSCVGTVVDKNAKTSITQASGSGTASNTFDGISKVNAISHNKIELFFSPASSGDPSTLTYEIYVNNSPIPIKVSGKSLKTDPAGLYYFTVTGLATNSYYNFNMRVVEAGSEALAVQLDPTKSQNAKTFANETADFMGISSLTLGAGAQSKDTITVQWVPATTSKIGINSRDPVQYEVSYTDKGLSKLDDPILAKSVYLPLSVGVTNNVIEKGTTLDLTALTPDTIYYVRVRALHKGWYDYHKTDSLYKREMNTRVLSIRTLPLTGGLFSFDPNITLLSPLGIDGQSKLDVSWYPAMGDFFEYRVCYKVVSDVLFNLVQDQLKEDNTGLLPILNTAQCSKVAAKFTSFRLAPLTTYSYYQVKVIACKNSTCLDQNSKIFGSVSPMAQSRIIATVASFTGILGTQNPTDSTSINTLNQITLNFDAPLTDTGFMTDFTMYCYNGPTDTAPVAIPTDGTVSVTPTKAICNGIKNLTTMPNHLGNPDTFLADYGRLSSLTLQLPTAPEGIDGIKRYCFSLVPSIVSVPNSVNVRDANPVVKCITPVRQKPTLLQFPGIRYITGKLDCSFTGTKVTIKWDAPTAGLYNNYLALYREKTLPQDLFRFDIAGTDFINTKTNNADKVNFPYSSATIAGNAALLEYTTPDLTPGKTYSFGVLTYLQAGAKIEYSQYNLNVCEVVLPPLSFRFNEWVDIFAVGPKENGLTATTDADHFMLETLDNDGIPVEIASADNMTPDAASPLAFSRMNTVFNGVFGAKDAKDSNAPYYQYSNSGMIRFGWKDVTVNSGANGNQESMQLNINKYDPAPISKKARQYGYKVYRSEDNQLTWVDMTQYSTLNKFQKSGSVDNSGLVLPTDLRSTAITTYKMRTRNNLPDPSTPTYWNGVATVANPSYSPTDTDNFITFFTDYSVKFSGSNGEVDRARTYWYKIVPVFNNTELIADQGDPYPAHNIIRVTLPPKNMALVHRMMANRTMCLEMGKTIEKLPGVNYRCPYDGIGSAGATLPRTSGNATYDLGGDLLVDRFELSCPFTRGSRESSPSASASQAIVDKSLFSGVATNSNNFKGCYNNTSILYEPNQQAPGYVPPIKYTNKQVAPGDCFGNDGYTVLAYGPNNCSANPYYYITAMMYPGSDGQQIQGPSDCAQDANVWQNLTNLTNPASKILTDMTFFPTQSEFAAVYYTRSQRQNVTPGSNPNSFFKMPGANGKVIDFSGTNNYNNSSCKVNLAFKTPAGQYIPRWISVNALFGETKIGGAAVTLYNKTIAALKSGADLYDDPNGATPNVLAPTITDASRFNDSSTLARVVTSNSAKVPPLDGMGQKQLYNACQTYQVEVGVESSTRAFSTLQNVQNKRLLRKRESTAASAWPAHYDNALVTAIESGTHTEGAGGAINNSCNSLRKYATLQRGTAQFRMGDDLSPLFPQANVLNPTYMEGSSTLDAPKDNSEKCVSRFGIQDFAGNLRELHAEEIFCDYTKDIIYLKNSSFAANDPAKSLGNQAGTYYDPLNVSAFVQPTTDLSGVCSVQDNVSDRYYANGIFTKPSMTNNGVFLPIYDTPGHLSSIIYNAKSFDQMSVDNLRNGDGSFMEFGPSHIFPPLNVNDTASLAGPTNYFNPVLGMTLGCANGTCSSLADNTEFTSDHISPNTLKNNAGNTPINFPTNNAVITNDGISTLVNSWLIPSTDTYRGGIQFIDADNSGTPANPVTLLMTQNIDPNNPVTPAVNIQYSTFTMTRGSTVKFLVGGSAKSESGRYSLDIQGIAESDLRSINENNGGRCAVMINEN